MRKHEQPRKQSRTPCATTNDTKNAPQVRSVSSRISTGAFLVDPSGLLRIQRQAGNSAAAMLFQGNRGLITPVQRDAPPKTGKASTWREEAKKAKEVLTAGNRGVAEGLYRSVILKAASAVTLPKGLAQPGLKDIRIDFDLTDAAQTRGKEVSNNPDDPWRWIFFGRNAVMETQANTAMIITHELVHVEQYQSLWNSYNKQSSDKKNSWDDYRKPFDRRTLVEGPVELQAAMSALRFIQRLSRQEQQEALRGLFVAYAHTSIYKPSKNERLIIDPTAAQSQILDFYAKAQTALQDRMGNALWWSLIQVDKKDTWIRALKDLKPIAQAGYSDTKLRPLYDDFLKDHGLDFAKILRGT